MFDLRTGKKIPMGKINGNIVTEAKNYVEKIIDSKLSKDCVYHSKNHTFDVLKNVQTIGDYYLLGEDDMNILRICALFHDVGYVNVYDGHEYESAEIATEFLLSKNVDTDNIALVNKSILATQIPQNPQDIIGRILCDADMMHLTYEDYFDRIDLMRLEWSNVGKVHLNKLEFHEVALDFFKSHNFHTEYGKTILEPLKQKIAIQIKKKLINASST